VVDDSVVVGGLKRTYRLWVPQTYTGTTPLPIIVNYHGTGGDPQSVDDFSSNLSQKANARNYLVVSPQADKGDSSTVRWSVPGIGTVPDDVAFTNAMLDKIASEFCVDAKRIYATGFSSGGAMTTWIACSDSDRFAAAVPGGGVNLVDPSCQKAPIPMFAYHGTKDQFAFFNGIGGNPTKPDPANAGKFAFFGGVEQDMTYWAKGNGCQPNYTDYKIAPDATLRVWPNCAVSTQLLLAIGGGHTFPGGVTRLNGELGATIQDVNMANEMLNWLDTQAKL
jgi:polyhydroxybutyrate depolymerase